MSTPEFDLSEDVRLALLSKLQEKGLQEFFREMMAFVCNEIMEMERTEFLNADPYERTDKREGQRNGYKDREPHTSVGTLELPCSQGQRRQFSPEPVHQISTQ